MHPIQAHPNKHKKTSSTLPAFSAQGTIEYLTILSVVIVIAMIVTGLVVQIVSEQSAGIPEKQAIAKWKTASPWAIVDWTREKNVLSIVLRNMTSETLLYLDMNVTPTDSNTTQTSVGAGATLIRTFTITNPTYICPADGKYILPKENIGIDYNAASLPQKSEYGVSDLVGNCA